MEQQLDILNGPAVDMQPPAGKRRAGRSGRDDVVATRVHPDIKRRFIEEAKKRDWSPSKLLALALTEWIAGQSDTPVRPLAVSLPAVGKETLSPAAVTGLAKLAEFINELEQDGTPPADLEKEVVNNSEQAAPAENIETHRLSWLVNCTATDTNFESQLKQANKETLKAAIGKLEGQPYTKTALKRLKGRLNAIEREERRSLGIAAQVRQHHV